MTQVAYRGRDLYAFCHVRSAAAFRLIAFDIQCDWRHNSPLPDFPGGIGRARMAVRNAASIRIAYGLVHERILDVIQPLLFVGDLPFA